MATRRTDIGAGSGNAGFVDEAFFCLVFDAMVLAASCDGSIHETELSVLADFLKVHQLDGVRNLPEAGPIADFSFEQVKQEISELAAHCENHRQRCYFLKRLSQIADADAELHENETRILAVLDELWETDIAFSKHIEEWTPSQKHVIESPIDGRIIVEAPPGAGKTAIIAARIEHLVNEQGVEPSNVWLISFTRTAVREMKDRIGLMATEYPQGLRVATLDSAAFAMNMALGMSETHAFSGYEYSINEFVNRLESQDVDLMDFLEGLEHLIIDEAQDLIGNRRELCFQLIEKLPEDCGVTILGDEFQQIYGGWSQANQSGPPDVVSLQQRIEQMREDIGFQRVELSEIHRTSSPELLALVEDLRLDLAVYDESAAEDFHRRQQMLRDRLSGVSRDELVDKVSDNCLILYRSRAEVLAASMRLTMASRVFKLRLPTYPRYVAPWVNTIFREAHDSEIENLTSEALQTISTKLLSRDQRYFERERVWDYLREVAGEEGGVSMARLRERLGKSAKKSVEFQHPEFGYSGPTIGTVHSSKGREAEDVYFKIPEQRPVSRSSNTDHGEESRVLFVGASRAKNNLQLVDGGRDPFSKGWIRSGVAGDRHFKRFSDPRNPKAPTCFAEIGLDGDFDPYSAVSIELGAESIAAGQRFLETYWPIHSTTKCFARYDQSRLAYHVFVRQGEDEILLGMFSEKLHTGLVKGSADVFRWRHYPPKYLGNLYIVDVAAHVATRDDDRLEKCLKEYTDRGSWLYPVIFGFGPFTYRHG